MKMRTVQLPSGEKVPALGQGTWRMGENARARQAEIDALRLGIDLGMTLIDTAEMYASGGAEEVVGEAIQGRRGGAFVVTKASPHHAGRKDLVRACERSLRRLGTDRIDLYLLHWRGAVPLEETVAGFEELRQAGKIRHWGVSNFGVRDMDELTRIAGGRNVAADQVLYNLESRGVEWDLLPWFSERSIPLMAYTPFGQGRMLESAALREVAGRHGASAGQVALAWLLRRKEVIAIPKASRPEHVRENRAASDLALSQEDLQALDRAFAPPTRAQALETA